MLAALSPVATSDHPTGCAAGTTPAVRHPATPDGRVHVGRGTDPGRTSETGADVRADIAATTGSSALSTATPLSGRASISSPFGPGHRFQRAEHLQMHRLDAGDHPDRRLAYAAEQLDARRRASPSTTARCRRGRSPASSAPSSLLTTSANALSDTWWQHPGQQNRPVEVLPTEPVTPSDPVGTAGCGPRGPDRPGQGGVGDRSSPRNVGTCIRRQIHRRPGVDGLTDERVTIPFGDIGTNNCPGSTMRESMSYLRRSRRRRRRPPHHRLPGAICAAVKRMPINAVLASRRPRHGPTRSPRAGPRGGARRRGHHDVRTQTGRYGQVQGVSACGVVRGTSGAFAKSSGRCPRCRSPASVESARSISISGWRLAWQRTSVRRSADDRTMSSAPEQVEVTPDPSAGGDGLCIAPDNHHPEECRRVDVTITR